MRKISPAEIKKLQQQIHFTALEPLIKAIAAANGQAFLVGGAVRDFLLDIPLKDLDIEVHSLQLEQLKRMLEKFGQVNAVGKSFGVLKFRLQPNQPEIDFSLPRSDSAGRKPQVAIDPSMAIEQALRRRDLTINAMAIDLATNELHDPFGGEKDLQAKKARCPDAALFVEDPLRFYRVMQFIARFNLEPDEQLNKICTTMDVAAVSRERIEEEIKKLMLKAEQPSRGFRWVLAIGRLQELFPELAALVTTVQSPVHHPEGNVFEHTMQVIDVAAQLRKKFEDEFEQLTLMYAALCHDLGKPATTVVYPDGKVTSYEHEVAGVEIAQNLMKRFCGNKELIAVVKKLVRHHMAPGMFVKSGAHPAAYKRLALKLAPETNCYMLALLCEADRRGRGLNHTPLPGPVEAAEQFIAQVEKADVLCSPEAPLLTGKDFLDVEKPGPKLGELVKKAYKLQIEKNIKDKDELKKLVLQDQ